MKSDSAPSAARQGERVALHVMVTLGGVERFLILGPAALERYAALGELITDDNQRLAYDLVRSQQAAFGPPRMAYANVRLIRQIARGLDAQLPQPGETATAAPRRRP